MFTTLLLASILWLAIFIVSAAFDAWFEFCEPPFLTNNVLGRTVAVFLIAPLILTIAVGALLAVPVVAFADFIDDPWKEDIAWQETTTTLGAAFEWFTQWAPAYVMTGVK